jgi:hypothetical protein
MPKKISSTFLKKTFISLLLSSLLSFCFYFLIIENNFITKKSRCGVKYIVDSKLPALDENDPNIYYLSFALDEFAFNKSLKLYKREKDNFVTFNSDRLKYNHNVDCLKEALIFEGSVNIIRDKYVTELFKYHERQKDLEQMNQSHKNVKEAFGLFSAIHGVMSESEKQLNQILNNSNREILNNILNKLVIEFSKNSIIENDEQNKTILGPAGEELYRFNLYKDLILNSRDLITINKISDYKNRSIDQDFFIFMFLILFFIIFYFLGILNIKFFKKFIN